MQFAVVALLFAAVTKAANETTVTDLSSTLVTITSCGPEVTDCPAKNETSNVSTWEGAANKQYAVGAAALAAGALLAL
ncbi:protein Tos6p [[Candida] jaroonii]|uniref:Protein Tos6p n=1 Tax=[Candida] jaroonii TaxID=467808 RepID=A0ACA9Y0N9_9ASCO|nr:protein Tos6p [[Candida] jaroonii]